jgi:hypothetical protein
MEPLLPADKKGFWTIVHGFYADSGGFVLCPRDSDPFPVSAKQIHYLVENGYIEIPGITEKEILDKSKGDKFTKTIACLQTFWFITQCLARICQRLPVSPLELQTCSIILCTVTTYFLWLYKPLSVQTPTQIPMSIPIALVLKCANISPTSWRLTPLDFIQPESHILGLWEYTSKSYGPYKGPLSRIPNDMNPCLYNLYQRAYLGLNVIAFSTISFSEWYFHFPSKTEQLMWRISCLTAESSLFVHAVAEAVGNRKRRQMKAEYNYIEGYKLGFPKGVLFFWCPFVTYLLARICIIGLALVSLRDLPEGCYWTVPWSNFVPHVS